MLINMEGCVHCHDMTFRETIEPNIEALCNVII